MCERAGVKRFFIEWPHGREDETRLALGAFWDSPKVAVVESLDQLLTKPFGLNSDSPCLALSGNLVFARSQLKQAMTMQAAEPGRVAKLACSGEDQTAVLASGPLGPLLTELASRQVTENSSAYLPYALDGRPEDGREAELRLARSIRFETADKDGLLARLFDRKISWRVSYLLSHTRITPNQVTIFNTALGFLTAWMLATPTYWWRLAGALLFLAGVTLDGVDGELARLRMTESEWGGKLDVITDNIVHVALFIGLVVGCYRASGSPAYFYLLPIQLGGFGLCAIAINRAIRTEGDAFIARIERLSGRDFAYLLVVLAAINHLEFFVWATAFGTYVFALGVWWLTNRHNRANERLHA
jgi:phosphatidylglycerophosphate synthase